MTSMWHSTKVCSVRFESGVCQMADVPARASIIVCKAFFHQIQTLFSVRSKFGLWALTTHGTLLRRLDARATGHVCYLHVT